MANLDSIVNVAISLNTASVPGGVFGIQMIAAPFASFPELVRTYSDYDASNPDNLPPEVSNALSAAFSQTPRPSQVKVGRLSMAKTTIAAVDAIQGATYGITIGTTPVNVVAGATPTLATIATQLAAAINTAAAGVTATAVAGVVELVYTAAPVGITALTRTAWGVTTPSATVGIVATDLSAINGADADWYTLHMVERTQARVLSAAAWVEGQEKIFVTALAEPGILVQGTTNDTGSLLAPYFRTVWAYHSKASTQYADVAWAARMGPTAPGSETWALKKLAGIDADNLTDTQRGVILAKGGNTFEKYATAIALTNPGKTAAGEWIDVIRFRDWLRSYIQSSLVQLIASRDKVPYTDGGLQLLGNNLRASLREGQRVGGIAPDEVDADGVARPGFNLTIPRASEVSANVKASRVASFQFNARIAGAIHVATITGALSYEL